MTDVKIAAVLINWVSGEAGNAVIINIRVQDAEVERGCFVVSLAAEILRWPRKPSSGHLHTDMWNTSALPHRPGAENRIMYDLAKQNTPQAWLCMALTFSLSGWCLFKRGSRGMWSRAAQECPTQSLALRLTSSLSASAICIIQCTSAVEKEIVRDWKCHLLTSTASKRESQFPPVIGGKG